MSDEFVVHAPMSKCLQCLHYRISLFPVKKIELDDKMSTVFAVENITGITCRKNRIRFKGSNEPKVYSSKYGLTCIDDDPDMGTDCPDFCGD